VNGLEERGVILKTALLGGLFIFFFPLHHPLEAKTLYQWKDEAGVVHITDRRPPRGVKAKAIAYEGGGGAAPEEVNIDQKKGEVEKTELIKAERARKRDGDIREAKAGYEKAKALKEQLERSYRTSRNAIRKVNIKKQIEEASKEMERRENILRRLEAQQE